MVAHRMSALAAAAVLAGAAAVAQAAEPEQPATPEQIVAYHDSGEWDGDITRQFKKARTYLAAELKKRSKRKPAVVFDIDDTALSSYDCMKKSNFDRASQGGCVINQDQPAIVQARSLYNFARKRKVTVFFVTGRPEAIRELTLNQLGSQGFKKGHKLYMRKRSGGDSAAPEKTAYRKRIVRAGYRIIVNIGDQQSDLKGGYAQRRYKVPNPMYFTP